MKKHIPNIITLGNLFCGCLAISTAFEGKLYVAAYLLIVASALDFFDGFAARILKVSNPIGKELDSLADMISFGLAPGILLYKFTKMLNHQSPIELLTNNTWLFYIAFLIPLLSALRLAKFNLDTRQTSSFIGLPTPANTSFFLFPVIIYYYPNLPKIIDLNFIVIPILSNPLIMLGLGVIFSLLLVAEIPMCSLKFKSTKWAENKMAFSFILTWFVLLIFTNILAMPAIVLIYVIFSTINHILSPNKVAC